MGSWRLLQLGAVRPFCRQSVRWRVAGDAGDATLNLVSFSMPTMLSHHITLRRQSCTVDAMLRRRMMLLPDTMLHCTTPVHPQYMTRDQVERLLEEAVLGVEKRLAQQQQRQQQLGRGEVQLAALAANGTAGGGPGSAANSPQTKVVRSLKPLAEGEPLGLGPSAHDAAAAALAGSAAAAAAATEGSQRGGSSMRGGMPRVRSLSAVQQAMSRAYQSGGTGGWGREVGKGRLCSGFCKHSAMRTHCPAQLVLLHFFRAAYSHSAPALLDLVLLLLQRAGRRGARRARMTARTRARTRARATRTFPGPTRLWCTKCEALRQGCGSPSPQAWPV